MGPVTCFLIEATSREQQHLRRYADGPCPGNPGPYSYHNAMTHYVGDAPSIVSPEGYRSAPEAPDSSDPRWPTKCDKCDYHFKPEDNRQVFTLEWYMRPDTGERFLMRSLPPGAMYDSWWMSSKGPDGKCWTVILPDGNEWMIDGPSASGGHWTRSGTAPRLTANPSILTPKYHGWLREGVLVPC